MHQRSKIICLLSRVVINRKIDKEFAKNVQQNIHAVDTWRANSVRVVKLFGAIRCTLAVPCRQLFVQ